MCTKLIGYGLKGLIGIFFTVFLYASVYADSDKIQNPGNGHWYQRFDTTMTWHEAKAFCESLGGHLATVTSQAEHGFVYNNVASVSSQHCWLGATDEAQEGVWEWTTNEPWDYTKWSPGEPNNCAGEHYLHYFLPPDFRAGSWNDVDEANHGSCGWGCPSRGRGWGCPNGWRPMSTICEWEAEVCSCPTDSCPDKGCISGMVEDADTGQPLADKLVNLKRIFPKGSGMTLMNVVTDTGGCYSFSNLDDGTYRITVKGCKGGGKKVVVISGGSKEEGKNFQCK